jgi:uncharacterized protein YuzE
MEKTADINGINILESIPYLLNMPSNQTWIDYDDEADVLYISFRKPQHANDSVMEGNIIYNYHDNELVGLSILHAKKMKKMAHQNKGV